MSWNEPGGDKKDPWSGRKDSGGPPDLDEVIRSFQDKLGGILGGGSEGGSSDGSPFKGLGILALGAFALWCLSGFYIVDEGKKGVETRFGSFVAETEPGLNWHFPSPIDQVEIVDVQNIQVVEVGYRSGGSQGAGSVPREALMLTKDENIVDIRLAVQYQVSNAKDYVFNVLNPSATLKQITESAERGVIGRNDMDFVLTEGRSEIVAAIQTELQTVLDAYQSGIVITSVNLQDAQPPEQVQGAFEDAIKAREDEQRYINKAIGYAKEVVPVARGAAARRVQEAEGYKEKVIARATGKVSRFSQLLKEYKKAPEVTRRRMYLESMEEVLAKTSTVMVDVKGGNNMLYLPLDKLGNRSAEPKILPNAVDESFGQPVQQQRRVVNGNTRMSNRGRDVRGR